MHLFSGVSVELSDTIHYHIKKCSINAGIHTNDVLPTASPFWH